MLAIQWSDLDEKLSNRSCDMYLGAVQAPGLGKFCGQRYLVSQVLENNKILEHLEKSKKIDVHSAKSCIWRERDFHFRGACP